MKNQKLVQQWHEISTSKVKVFQLNDEPEIIYVIKVRPNEFMIVHEDAYDQNTGKVEFLNTKDLKESYGIEYG